MKSSSVVIPVETGIQDNYKPMDSCFRRNDKEGLNLLTVLFSK